MSTDRDALLHRITVVPGIFGGKPVIRGRRLAVEHVLGMLAAGDDEETILAGYSWLEPEDIRACLVVGERIGHIEEYNREWRRDVEEAYGAPQGVAVSDLHVTHGSGSEQEQELEWTEDVEPDYDSEEDAARTVENQRGHYGFGDYA